MPPTVAEATEALREAAGSASYPYLNISRRLGVPYGTALRIGEIYTIRGLKATGLTLDQQCKLHQVWALEWARRDAVQQEQG